MFKKLAKDTAIYGLSSFVFRFIAFAIFPIYAHTFSVADFGIMELATTLAGIVSLFMNLGMNNAVMRYYWDPGTKEADRSLVISTGLWLLLGSSVIVSGIMIALLHPWHKFIEIHYHLPWLFLILVFVSNIPSQVLVFCQDVLRLHFAPWKFTILSAFSNLFGVALILWLILRCGLGLKGFFVGGLIGLSLALPICFWLIRRDLRLELDPKLGRKLIAFGYPFIFAGLAYWIFSYTDRWMLATMTDNVQVGLYSIAFKFAFVITFINGAFAQAWSPYAVKIYSEDPNYRLVFSRLLSLWFFGLTLVGSMLTVFAPEILRLLTPPAYWPAANVMGLVTMGIVFLGTTQITVIGISLAKRTNLLSLASWITALINVVLNLILIPYWGAIGAALATLISYLILTGMYLCFTQRLHLLPLEVKKLVFSLLVIVVVLITAMAFNIRVWLWWFVGLKVLLLSGIIYGGYKMKTLPDIKNLLLSLRKHEKVLN